MSRDRFVLTQGQIRTLMTFTRTYKNALMALTLFGLLANDGHAADVNQASTPTSSSALVGDQLQFDEGVAAYDSGDFAGAYAIWLPLAKAGDLGAMRNVGHMLRLGVGVEQDIERALWFYERAARAGLASAALNAGMLRIEPGTSYYDVQKGAEWLDLAAVGGSPDAMWELAQLIEREEKTAKNTRAAQALIRQAGALGHEQALKRLASKPEVVTGQREPASTRPVVSPQLEARGADIPLVSPEQGASFMKGVYLFDAGDFSGAQEIWRPLAENGVVEAQYRLGRLYRFGLGVTPDVDIARKWLSAAASMGHEKAAETLSILPSP
jgi:hypothetical protein